VHAAAWGRNPAFRLVPGLAVALFAIATPAVARITSAPPAVSAGAEMNRQLHRGETPRAQALPSLGLPSLGGLTALAGFTAGPGFTAYDFDQNQIEAAAYVVPANPSGAAGPDRLVNVVNAGIECWTKSGTLLFRDSLKDFFAGTSGKLGTLTFDARVLYDTYAGRFVVVALEQTDTTDPAPADASRILIAVSKTSAPATATATSWYYKSIDSKITIGGIPCWADFPGLAVDEDVVYITANLFNFASYPATYAVRLWILRKGVSGGLYGGGALVSAVYDPYASAGLAVTTTPARVFGPGGAGPGIGTYLAGYDNLTFGGLGGNEAVQVVRVGSPTGTPSFTQEFVVVGDLENVGGVYGFPSLPDAPQTGSAVKIEVGDSRVLDAVWRNEALWFTADIKPNPVNDAVNANQTTAHWFRLNTAAVADSASPAGLLTLADQGNLGGEDIAAGTYTFYPSLAVNGLGTTRFGFSASAPSLFVGAYTVGRESGDPAGTVGPDLTVHAGLDTYVRTFGAPRNLWGGHSAVCLDPADDRVFWAFNAYAMLRGTPISSEDGRWKTAWLPGAPSCLTVTCPPDTTLPMGADPGIAFCIVNCGEVGESFDFTLADTGAWCAPLVGSLFVDAGDSACVVWECTNPPLALCADTTQVRCFVTSAGGAADSCSTTVRVADNPPVAMCRNVAVVGDTLSCTATVSAANVDNGSFDPDGQAMNLLLVPAGPFPEGDTGVQLVVTDACGASDTCAATITVTCPELPPRLDCAPSAIVIPAVAALDTVCRTITVYNTGIGDPLVITAITGCGANGFHLDLASLDSTVAAGDSTTFRVCYTPDDAVPDTCLVTIDTNDTLCTVSVAVGALAATEEPELLRRLTLAPVTPNPFSAEARIRFTLPEAGPVRVEIFDARGRQVRELLSGTVLAAGAHAVAWDGRGAGGEKAAAGLYFVRVTASGGARVTRAVLTR